MRWQERWQRRAGAERARGRAAGARQGHVHNGGQWVERLETGGQWRGIGVAGCKVDGGRIRGGGAAAVSMERWIHSAGGSAIGWTPRGKEDGPIVHACVRSAHGAPG